MESLSDLGTLLRLQLEHPSQEGYALALNASRSSPVNQHLIAMLFALYDRDGQKWIQVVSRLAAGSPEKTAELCQSRFEMQRAIVSNLEHFAVRKETYQHIIACTVRYISTTLPVNMRVELVWETLGRLLEQALDLELPVRDVWVIFDQLLLTFLDKSRNMQDHRYLKCLQHLCKYLSQAEDIGGLNEGQVELLSTLYLGSLNWLLANRAFSHSLELLIEAAKCFTLYNWFHSNFNILTEYIGEVMKGHSSGVARLLASDFKEALNLEHDIIFAGDSGTHANIASHLLITLVVNLDGVLPMLTGMCIDQIEGRLLAEASPNYNLQQAANQNMELSCLFLSIIANRVGERGDLNDKVSMLFERSYKRLFRYRHNEPLLNIRVVQLIERFSGCLLGHDLQEALALLLACIENGLPAQSHKACEALQSIVSSNEVGLLQPYIHELSSKIYKLSLTSDNEQFFGMLQSFIEVFPILTDMYCVSLVDRLVNKVYKNVHEMLMKGNGDCQLALCAINCLEAILKKKDVVRDLSNEIDVKLQKLCNTLADSRAAKALEGRVLLLAAMMIEATSEIQPFALECLRMMESLHCKSNSISDFCEVIYGCCRNSSEVIAREHPRLILMFARLPIATMLSEASSATQEFRKSCYMLHVILQYFRSYFNQHMDELEAVVTSALGLLAKYPMSQPLQGVLISARLIAPFQIPRLKVGVSWSEYENQLSLHYYNFLLSASYCQEFLCEFLDFFKLYSTRRGEMEIENAKDADGDYFKDWLNTLKFPAILTKPLESLRVLIENQSKSGPCNLPPQYAQLLREFRTTHLTNGESRKIVRIRS